MAQHPSDLQTSAQRWPRPECYYGADDIAALLDRDAWDIIRSEARPGEIADPDGNMVTILDPNLRARRRAA